MISFSRSAYVSGIRTPTGKHVTGDNEVEVPDTKDIYLQRVFAANNCYVSGKPRFETIVFQAGTTCRNGITYDKTWFRKALGFIIVKHKHMLRPNRDAFMAHNKDKSAVCNVKVDEQFVFVQYYDILGEEDVPKHNVDETLECIRLKWEQHGEHKDGREKCKLFALCPLDSVRGKVHIVRANALVELLHETVPYKTEFVQNFQTATEWKRDIFYVNRLFPHEDVHFKVRD